MFNTQKLIKIRIIALYHNIDAILKSLEDFGAIQITKSRYANSDFSRPTIQKLSEDLTFLRAMEKTLSVKQSGYISETYPRDLQKLNEKTNKFRMDYVWLKQTLEISNEAKNERNRIKNQMDTFEVLKSLDFPPNLLESKRVELYFAPLKVEQNQYLNWTKKQRINTIVLPSKSKIYSLSVIEKNKMQKFLPQCEEYLANRIEIPKEFAKHSCISKIFYDLGEEYNSANRKYSEANEKITKYLEENGNELVQLRVDLEMEAKIAELPNLFSKTQMLNVIEGWIESNKFEKFDSTIEKTTDRNCLVERIKTNELAPTKLKNPEIAKRFEFLVKFFSLPKSNEIDPTIIMAFTFPLIFGMILGDVGYGLLGVALSIALYLKVKVDFVKGASVMMFLSSLIAIIFGFIYGEVFGANSFLFLHLTPFIERGGNGIALLMAFALFVGVIHLALGYVLSIYDNLKHHHTNHAIAKTAWLGLEIAFVVLGALVLDGSLVSAFALNTPVNALDVGFGLFALICLILIVIFEGPIGLVEIPTLIANILSYLRIMALGLSGAILAKIIDSIPVGQSINSVVASVANGNLNPSSILSALIVLIAFSVLMILGQMLSFGLGVFEASIQTLRLHYVEFFSKFFKGGGIPFTPLREID